MTNLLTIWFTVLTTSILSVHVFIQTNVYSVVAEAVSAMH